MANAMPGRGGWDVIMSNEYSAFETAIEDHLECIDIGATELGVDGFYIIRILYPGPDQY